VCLFVSRYEALPRNARYEALPHTVQPAEPEEIRYEAEPRNEKNHSLHKIIIIIVQNAGSI